MANIKKNFNFRNGVQVDDDNLLVTTTGLVGIGTTIPTEALDVRGNVNITGFCSFTTANIGIMTISTIKPTEIIGAGVSIKSGIVTAEGAGIVTYYGDARFLQGMPTSQWQDIDVGLGFTSIYNAGGNVGIATSNPQFTLQVGGDVDSSQEGIGISSVGNIKATGIVTATSFVGNLSGNITGATSISGNINANGNIVGDNSTNITGINNVVASGEIESTLNIKSPLFSIAGTAPRLDFTDTDNNPDFSIYGSGSQFIVRDQTNSEDRLTINSSGDVTIGGNTNFGADIDVDGHTNLDNVNVAGVTTFTGNIDANGDLDVDGHTNLDNVSVAGVSTFAGIIEGVAGQNKIPFLYSNMADLPAAGSYHGAVAHVHATGSLYYAHAGQWWELVNKESDGRVGTGTENYNIGSLNSSGIITATTELNSPLIGVGTDAPANDIQVRKSGNAEIQVTSDTGIAGLTVGRESGQNNTNNAEFRYGGGVGAPYSSAQSLDLLNYGTGNFNYYISANNPGGADGDFQWHKGLNSTKLMTLTNTGRLGIGETQPQTTFHVQGISTVTGNSFVGGTLGVDGNASVGGNLSVIGDLSLSSTLNANVSGNVAGNLTGSVNSTGISTFAKVAIGTYAAASGIELDGSQIRAVFNTVAVGTTDPESGADFKNCGAGVTDRFLIPPTVTTTQRNSITTPVDGGLIFNSTANRLEVYLQNAWVGIATVT